MKHMIDGAAYRKMVLSAAASIEIHKQKINDLNVFPVPDGDTGTNMSLTMQSAVREINAIMLAEHCTPAERMEILQ